MSVYVDNMRAPFGRMKMCHMVSDSEAELHEMADAIGLKREWFQDGPRPHYDVSLRKRLEAVRLGAVEIGIRDVPEIALNMRRASPPRSPR